ncbi:hypothetical protein ACFVR1_06055 [Psychrobacillus sp. NPDC058041]|uniref:hypothetical protein n=1 Tax=Psychrobacillus sp. NPDC058041 TaxID=3346310 RepID=UPI0036DAA599
MKKRIGSLFLSVIFLLVACSEDVTQYEAKASDFEDAGFENTNNQRIVAIGKDLFIFGNFNTKSKTSIDKILESENFVSDQSYQKKYKNVKITTKKDKYYITADGGISLEFKKIGDRIIVDEEGVEYFTEKYPEK